MMSYKEKDELKRVFESGVGYRWI